MFIWPKKNYGVFSKIILRVNVGMLYLLGLISFIPVLLICVPNTILGGGV
jgi:hypothetical protein